jgi:hypothetical protein
LEFVLVFTLKEQKMQVDPLKTQINLALKAAADAAQKLINENPDVWYPCGFAWVKIRPARGPVVKALKEMGLGDIDGYAGGYMVYNPSGNATQWMDAKVAGARAFADALKEMGVKATVESRID